MTGDDLPDWLQESDEPEIVHPVIGVCACCGGEAFTRLGARKLCWGCAYGEVN